MNWPDDYLIPGIEPYHVEKAGIIYCADCWDILPRLPKVDLLLTDPPYGINIVNKNGVIGGTSKDIKRWAGQINHQYLPIIGDDKPIDPRPLLIISEQQIIWGGNYIADRLPPTSCWLVWYKRIKKQINDMADCELAWTSFNKPARVFQHLWMGMLRDSETQQHYHPTQKPLALMKWCIRQDNGGLIFDPFLGSGTTAVAAKELGRKFIGIEISKEYCAIAVKRLRQGVLEF